MTTHEFARRLLALEEVPMYRSVSGPDGVVEYREPLDEMPTFSEKYDPVLVHENEKRAWEIDNAVRQEEEEKYQETGVEKFSSLFRIDESDYCDKRIIAAWNEHERVHKTIPIVRCLII